MTGALQVANISWRFIRTWNRNLVVYRRIWLVNFLVPLFEPLLYLAAFGVGLSALIGKVSYHGTELSYIEFIAPALLAITIMYNAFFENTYASFVRMYYQKTFDAMMATPLSLEDIIAGEIVVGRHQIGYRRRYNARGYKPFRPGPFSSRIADIASFLFWVGLFLEPWEWFLPVWYPV